MRMGLSSADFQQAMNHIFWDQIGRFIHIYIDVFIYSRTPQQHFNILKPSSEQENTLKPSSRSSIKHKWEWSLENVVSFKEKSSF